MTSACSDYSNHESQLTIFTNITIVNDLPVIHVFLDGINLFGEDNTPVHKAQMVNKGFKKRKKRKPDNDHATYANTFSIYDHKRAFIGDSQMVSKVRRDPPPPPY